MTKQMELRQFKQALQEIQREQLKRFREKQQAGFSGWDDPENYYPMSVEMDRKAFRLRTGYFRVVDRERELVDIANYATFLFKLSRQGKR